VATVLEDLLVGGEGLDLIEHHVGPRRADSRTSRAPPR
jgi:hypothetical protein